MKRKWHPEEKKAIQLSIREELQLARELPRAQTKEEAKVMDSVVFPVKYSHNNWDGIAN